MGIIPFKGFARYRTYNYYYNALLRIYIWHAVNVEYYLLYYLVLHSIVIHTKSTCEPLFTIYQFCYRNCPSNSLKKAGVTSNKTRSIFVCITICSHCTCTMNICCAIYLLKQLSIHCK